MALQQNQGDTFSYVGPITISPPPANMNAQWNITAAITKVVGGALVFQFSPQIITAANNTIGLFANQLDTFKWPIGELFLRVTITSADGTVTYTTPPILIEVNPAIEIPAGVNNIGINIPTDYEKISNIVNSILAQRSYNNIISQLPLVLNSDNQSITLPADFNYKTRLIFVNGLYYSPLQYTVITNANGTVLTFNNVLTPNANIVGVPLW